MIGILFSLCYDASDVVYWDRAKLLDRTEIYEITEKSFRFLQNIDGLYRLNILWSHLAYVFE